MYFINNSSDIKYVQIESVCKLYILTTLDTYSIIVYVNIVVLLSVPTSEKYSTLIFCISFSL